MSDNTLVAVGCNDWAHMPPDSTLPKVKQHTEVSHLQQNRCRKKKKLQNQWIQNTDGQSVAVLDCQVVNFCTIPSAAGKTRCSKQEKHACCGIFSLALCI
jgi:hypothetical protein